MLIRSGTSRAVLGGSLILAPLLLLAAGLLDPTVTADDERALLAIAAESSQALELTQLLYVLAGLTLIPAGFGLMRLIAPQAPRLALVAGGAVAASGLSLVAIEASTCYLGALATSDAPPAQQAAVVAAVDSSPGVLLMTTIHVVGLLGGILLAAAGLYRGHVIAPWVPVALVVGLLGSVAATDDVLIAAAGVLLIAGLGSAGARVLRSSRPAPMATARTTTSTIWPAKG